MVQAAVVREIPDNIVEFPFVPEQDPQIAAEEKLAKQKRSSVLDSIQQINSLVSYFLNRGQWRNALQLVVQLNTTFRIGDVRRLRWRHILNPDMTVKDQWAFEEHKNKHIKIVTSNEALKKMIAIYLNKSPRIDIDSYIFVSNGNNKCYTEKKKAAHNVIVSRRTVDELQPMDECSMNRIIRNAAKELGLYTDEHRITSHSNRKAAVVAMRGDMDGRDVPETVLRSRATVEIIAQVVGHKNPSTTEAYIMSDARMAKELFLALNLGLEAIEEFEKNEEK